LPSTGGSSGPTRPIGTQFCFCDAAVPVSSGTSTVAGGCLNVSATGAILTGSGSTSCESDDLVLTTTGLNPGTFAVTIRSLDAGQPVSMQNGLLCLAGTLQRGAPCATGTLGTATYGPGIVLDSQRLASPAGWILAGQTWSFQTWYRDLGRCGTANLSNALSVTLTP
jgi:hypothetical protein